MTTYHKVLSVMKFVLANYQHEGENALKEAAATYVGVNFVSEPKDDYEGNDDSGGRDHARGNVNSMNNELILSPNRKKSAGATSVKRKKSGAEMGVTSSKSQKRSCGLCGQQGHTMRSCPPADGIGKRITTLTWLPFKEGLEVSECTAEEEKAEADANTASDPAIPKKCIGLKVVSHRTMGETLWFKSFLVKEGLFLDEDRAFWFSLETIGAWCNNGKSKCHFVFVKNN